MTINLALFDKAIKWYLNCRDLGKGEVGWSL
jgi:hypothetical protein